jgi:hypothetical protein
MEQKPFYTVDGVKIIPGMVIWVYPTNGDEIEQRIASGVSQSGFKVFYLNPLPTDYVGCRINLVFSTKEAAEEAKCANAKDL